MVLATFKCTWIPILLHVLLNLSPSPWMYGTTMEMLLLFVPLLLGWLSVEVLSIVMLCLCLNLLSRMFRAHGEKLKACKAFLNVLHFLVKCLLIGGNYFSPVC